MRDLKGVIVGGGVTGLATAHFLAHAQGEIYPKSWEVWESDTVLGGTCRTERVDGYSIDHGPNGFLDREPLTLELVDQIGISDELERANESAGKRFIYKSGRLQSVPMSPVRMLSTGLLTLAQKLRVLREPFVPRFHQDHDETIYEFAARRIGTGAAETFVDPMVSGVFGGDARELSLAACFPVMREMEERYGSLVKAMLKKRHGARNNPDSTDVSRHSGGPAGPGGRLTSFRGGIDRLIERLGERLAPIVRLGCGLESIHCDTNGYALRAATGKEVRAEFLVMATPAHVCAKFLRSIDQRLSELLDAIPYASIAVVATGHHHDDVMHPLDGFGFLVPRSERREILGSIWTSSIFAGRAPKDRVLLRTMIGGASNPRAVAMSDDELLRTVQRELTDRSVIGLRHEPEFGRIYRWPRGIPQYVVGHDRRLEDIDVRLAALPKLYLAGNAYTGVGLNDCVKSAKRTVDAILVGAGGVVSRQ